MNRDQFFKFLSSGADIGSRAASQAQDNKLRQLLQGQQDAHDMAKLQAAQEADLQKLQTQSQLDTDASLQAEQRARDYVAAERAAGRKVSASFGKGTASISQAEANPMASYLQSQAEERRLNESKERRFQTYSKDVKPVAKLADAVTELETSTNTDGKGGVLSNPNAELKSRGTFGRVLSAIPVVGDKLNSMVYPDETAKIQAVLNKVVAEEAGLSQTAQEYEKQKIAAAQAPGADAETVREGLRTIARLTNTRAGRSQAILRPEERQEAFDRGFYNPDPLKKMLGAEQKTVQKKLYSRSANKTKLIYSDGTEEVVDGQQ
jgi:hypothetical protein